jgi:hypothetical protein
MALFQCCSIGWHRKKYLQEAEIYRFLRPDRFVAPASIQCRRRDVIALVRPNERGHKRGVTGRDKASAMMSWKFDLSVIGFRVCDQNR